MVNYAPDFLRFKQPYDPFSPTPDALPIRSPLLSEARANAVPVVKNWSHPFKDNRNPLQQLTHLGKAVAGFYPLGASGLWHGGIHFDGGTADTLDQSSVHCLADGEVVAYRIDQHSPTTMYWVNNITVNKPFSRNFVLVRHRLQLPKVESSEVAPPSLIFYSLYMHLQDWAVYGSDESIARPPFWSEGATRYVKPDVNDMHIRYPDQQGLNVRAHGPAGPILDLALRGSQIKVSGEGSFRKLENTSGPHYLKAAEGALRGYISADYLRPIADGQYRIHCATKLNIRAEPRSRDRFGKEVEVLGALPNGTEVTVSGEGAFRKLEHINQYVHYPSLQGKQEPLAQDQVVVLDQPVPIKAGDLIGHIGLYQDQGAQQPERKLHLEVFSGDDVEVFIKNSRAWAQRLPATSKTWLKLAKGTPVVAHQEHFSPQYPPTLSAASTPSDADLQIPKSLLDDLPAELKITVPAAWDRKTCNWYRLDGLLHDANNTLLKGWVCEEVGVTPWVSPWEWDGYDALFNFDPPRLMLASYLRIANRFDDVQLERFGPIADAGDKGPIKERLYDIIDRNRDDQITAAELRAALSLPAHAQSISQLIFHSESEWYHTPKKWDALDELLGHSGSTPNLNWLAEKDRIKQLGWWSEVAGKVGLPEQGDVYHFHPIGLLGGLNSGCAKECTVDVYELETKYGAFVVSKESFEFILETEAYRAYPYVPGGNSGVTVGYGYDLGQQVVAQARSDLSGIYSPQDIELLVQMIGKQGDQARNAVSAVGGIYISKEDALSLALVMKKRYAQLVTDVYPRVMDLHPHCQGVLLSLVINRGNSLTHSTNDSRMEMEQISDDLKSEQPEKIPSRLRAMKRLWEGKRGLGGLVSRRESEAKLFERGLKCDCYR
jgi:GH24 family phage-related lysozyme (muramidase)